MSVSKEKLSQRTFFKHSAGFAAGAAAKVTLLPGLRETGKLVADVVPSEDVNETLQMHNDLQRPLEKPMSERTEHVRRMSRYDLLGRQACLVLQDGGT